MSVSSAVRDDPLATIKGPGALGGDFRRFVHLTWLIAWTNFRLTYFGSVLGYLWSLARPLMLFGVLYVVFSQIVNFGDQIKDYPVLLLLNIVLWTFFVEATGASVQSLVVSEPLVRKMHFPRLVIPLATVTTALLNLAVNLVAVLVFLVAYGVNPRWSWLLLPVIVLQLVVFATGIAMLLSSLYVRYRDVAPIWAVISTALFYGSPVLYTIDTAPAKLQNILLVNPIASILEQARHWIVDPTAPTAWQVLDGLPKALVPAAVLLGAAGLGCWYFTREAPGMAERL